jgi:hypothetical protein
VSSDRDALIRETWKRWNEGARDPDQMGAGLTEDFLLESALTGRIFHGREGLVEWMAEIDESFDAWNLRIDEIRQVRSDRYLVLGGVHLHGRGSGVEFDQPVGWVVDFDGDLTRRLSNYASHEEAIEAAVREQA